MSQATPAIPIWSLDVHCFAREYSKIQAPYSHTNNESKCCIQTRCPLDSNKNISSVYSRLHVRHWENQQSSLQCYRLSLFSKKCHRGVCSGFWQQCCLRWLICHDSPPRILAFIGAFIQTASNGAAMMISGRIISGLATGFLLSTTPIYISRFLHQNCVAGL